MDINKQIIDKFVNELPISEAFWRYFEIMQLKYIISKLSVELPILDLGCGNGLINSCLFGRTEIGIDLDYKVAVSAKNNNVYNHVIVADACKLPFKDGTVGLVFSNCVLEHIKDIDVAFREIKRVLKHNGAFLFTVPADKFNDFLIFGYNKYVNYRNMQLRHYNILNIKDWGVLCEKNKFRIADFKYYFPLEGLKVWDFIDFGFHLPILSKLWYFVVNILCRRIVYKILLNIIKNRDKYLYGAGLVILAANDDKIL